MKALLTSVCTPEEVGHGLKSLVNVTILMTVISCTSWSSGLPQAEPFAFAPVDTSSLRLAFGVNQEYLASSGGHPRDSVSYESEQLRKMLRDVGVHYVRFPGGTLSNAYDWREERSARYVPSIVHSQQDRWSSMRSNENGFLDLCASISAAPVFVANVLLPSGTEGILDWISSRSSGPRAVKFWELGNELNLYTWHPDMKAKKLLTSVDEYIRLSSAAGRMALQRFPGIWVAANAESPPETYTSAPTPSFRDRLASWNAEIARNAGFYNAVSMHVYLYHARRSKGPIEGQTRDMFEVGDSLSTWLATWHGEFFGDKPLWITEFGTTGSEMKEQKFWGFQLAEINAYLRLIEDPGPVTIVLKHLGFSQGTGRVMFQRTVKERQELLRWTRVGQMYRMIADAIRSSDKVVRFAPIAESQAEQNSIRSEVTFVALSGPEKTSVLLVNKSPREVVVRLPWSVGEWHVMHYSPTDMTVDAVAANGALPSSGDLRLPPYAFAAVTTELWRKQRSAGEVH